MPTTGAVSDLCRTKQASGSLERFPGRKVQEAHPALTNMMWAECDGILGTSNTCCNVFHQIVTPYLLFAPKGATVPGTSPGLTFNVPEGIGEV
jgi:hypothetical protein